MSALIKLLSDVFKMMLKMGRSITSIAIIINYFTATFW